MRLSTTCCLFRFGQGELFWSWCDGRGVLFSLRAAHLLKSSLLFSMLFLELCARLLIVTQSFFLYNLGQQHRTVLLVPSGPGSTAAHVTTSPKGQRKVPLSHPCHYFAAMFTAWSHHNAITLQHDHTRSRTCYGTMLLIEQVLRLELLE